MKGRVILIDMPEERASQAALLVNGRLEDLLLDPLKGDRTPAPGEIYWAKVDRLVPKMGGAFVQLAPEHMGFLREAKGLKEGRGVLVQVTSYAEPGKAAPVTTRILYKSRTLIHSPYAPGVNVSRQIRDEHERTRLTRIVSEELETRTQPMSESARQKIGAWADRVFDQSGMIVRSAAEGVPDDELRTVVAALLFVHLSVFGQLESEGESYSMPLVPVEAGEIALREWTSPMPDSIWCSESGWEYLGEGIEFDPAPSMLGNSAELRRRLQRFKGPDLFDSYGVRDEIERLKSPRVDLPSGAWMAVEATRAMVTVDVNTAAEFSAGAALTANLEAVRELPRQLRLRGLGGQVIVDFAPLKKPDRRRVEDALKTAFRRDPVETTLAGWTPLGNFELQRKRERRPLTELLP